MNHYERIFRNTLTLVSAVGVAVLAIGCGAPALSPTPTPSPLPSPTPTPIPTPTPTPPPPVPLTIRFPETVSALEGVTVSAELPGLAERDPQARVWARVLPPGSREPVWESPLEPAEGGMYVSPRPVYFPLEPVPGDWRLFIEIQSHVPVRGGRWLRFRQEPLPLWDLTGQVPGEIYLPVPQPFALVRQEGDLIAGNRVWQRGGERIELWWAPGPAERLTLDTARMLEEATFPIGETVEVVSVETITRGKRPGFRFREQWSNGPAETLLLQGSSRYLYLLRVRVWGRDALTPLLGEILAEMTVK
ncbi:MAG: hypothetical protein N2556_03890 [Anaerolineae bacterium]|nr:hypothetical protein [Anaerolineae bacterium]